MSAEQLVRSLHPDFRDGEVEIRDYIGPHDFKYVIWPAKSLSGQNEMSKSKIAAAIRSERQDNYTMNLKEREPAEWREYLASKREPLTATARNETTGY